MRVPQFLADQSVEFETMYHPPAFTASKRAKYLHVSGRQLIKTVLLRGPSGCFVAVLPSTAYVDVIVLGRELGGAVMLASGNEIPEVFRDCEWGALTPFGSLYGLPTLLDDSIDTKSTVVFEGHSHYEAIRMRCCDYEAVERPRRLRFAVTACN